MLLNLAATIEGQQADNASRTASLERRADEWILQANLAARELAQNGRQIIGSLIAEQVARHEYDSICAQIENSNAVDAYLKDKFSNEELYSWMQGEVSRLFYEYYRFALDVARKAERAMKQELMRPELDRTDFVRFNYWEGGRKGLLSGEALQLDLKRMELAYLDNNKREIELTRHVSLRQIDPLALLSLRVTGRCEVTVPEWLYDRDCPGHYLRRIKSVAVSTVRSAAAEQQVFCTASLLRSSVRKSPLLRDGEYLRLGVEDDRFINYAGAIQSIVTSGGIRDTGLFDPDLHGDRFLPFEGAGAISTWKLDLPKEFPAFDYSTIADVILHISYTARQGLDAGAVTSAIKSLFQQTLDAGPNFSLLFTLQQDFADEWQAFGAGGQFEATIRRNQFPYLTDGKTITVAEIGIVRGERRKAPRRRRRVRRHGGSWDQPRLRVPRRAGCTRSAAGAQPECNNPGVPARTFIRYESWCSHSLSPIRADHS